MGQPEGVDQFFSTAFPQHFFVEQEFLPIVPSTAREDQAAAAA
jgi:hypothetical protein